MRERVQKNEILNNLTKQFNDHDCFYIIDLFKIKVSDISMFRRDCRKNNVVFTVAKNSLIHLALKNSKFDNNIKDASSASLNNMSGVLFVNEKHNLPAKTILSFVKNTQSGEMKFKCACVDNDLFIGQDKLQQLSKLKSKNELIADIMLSLQMPIKNVISGLKSSQDKICGILKTLESKSE